MNRNLLIRLGRLLFFSIGFLLIQQFSFGQTIDYTLGTLSVEIKIINSCQASPTNGAIQFTVITSEGGSPVSLAVLGPPNLFPPATINQGATYTYNAPQNLPPQSYGWLLGDGTNTIGSISDPVTYPKLVVNDLSTAPLGVTKDIEANNTSCVAQNGQIQGTITGGSKTIGQGAYHYDWSSTNGTPTTSGDVDGSTPLNLATLLGVSGLRGGDYTLKVYDLLSSCSFTQTFTITDPSPALYTVTTPSPLNICAGDNITLTLSNSEAGVTYEILKNVVSLPTPITFIGTATGPFVMTFPSTQFASGNNLSVRAVNGFCTPVLMTNTVNLIINPLPTVASVSIADVCQGATTASLTYGATTGSPNQYSIDYGATAEAQGFVDIVNASLTASPISITFPGGAAAGTYPAIFTVRNSTTLCPSVPLPFNFTIVANPTITLGPNPSICIGATTSTIPYTATTGSPNQYSINFDLAAEGAGFVDVPPSALPASPIPFNIPVTAGIGVYNATITVLNSVTGCVSTSQPLTVTINAIPTITLGASPVVCAGTTITLLPFSATTASPNQYIIDYDAAAEAQGFVDVATAILPAAPGNIGLTVPAGATPGVYNAAIAVANSTTTCTSPTQAFTITINPTPTITLTNPNPAVCLGTLTTNLAYSATTGSPSQYTLDFDAAAEAQGFVDVTTGLPASPIGVTIPGGAVAGVYNATLVVRNTTTTCVSPGLPVTVTINPNPTITLTNANPQVCQGAASVLFPYSATTGSPNQYSIVFNGAALAAGFVNVTNAALPVGQITVAIPGTAGAAIYNAALSITNGVTGCVSSTQPISITINPTPTITLNPIAPICRGTTSVNLVYSGVTGGANEYSIDFNAAAEAQGFVDVALTTLLASPVAIAVPAGATPGAYSATVQVVNSATTCPSAPQAITITINPLPTAAISGGGPVCAGSPLPNVIFTFTGTAPFTFTYTDGTTPVTVTNHPSTTFTIANAPAGNYSITALTDANTCVATSLGTPVSVIVNALPTAVASGGGTICAGGTLPNVTFTFTGTAPFTFTYTDGTTPVIVTNHPSTTYTITAAPAGTYQVTALTDANTCAATSFGSPVSVIVNPLPTAVISGGGPVCAGAPLPNVTFTFTGTAPFTFTYTDGTTPVTITNHPTTTFTIVNAPVGTYSISALTDANTCPATTFGTPVSVTVNPLPTANIGGTSTICQGNNGTLTFTLPATGTFNVVYTDGTINFTANGIANGATVSVSPTASISYTIVSVTNVTTGCSVAAPSLNITGSADITVIPTPTANIGGTVAICAGGNATLTFTLPTTGTYDVVYTDGATTFNANAIANGATVSVSPTATTTYTIISVKATGTSCLITSPNTNITGAAVITVNPVPTANIGGTTTICQGQNATLTFTLPSTGTFNVVYTDGTTNFNAIGIANGATVSVSPAADITYTIVSVSDVASTCTVTAPSLNITGAAVITVTPANTGSISGTTTICSGSNANLSITLDPGVYDVVITDGVTSFTLPGISNGTFLSVSPTATVTYTISSITNTTTGCTVTAPSPNITGNATITVNPSPTGTMSGSTTMCTGSATNIKVDFTGTGPWSFRYSDGTTTFGPFASPFNSINIPVNPTVTTTFTLVTVNDATACPGVINGNAVVTVNQPPLTNLAVGATINPLCNGGISDVTVSNSQLGVSYQLRNNAGNANIGTPVVGTGSTISLSTGALTATTTFNVLATAGGCTPAQLTNTVTINVAGSINAALAVTSDASTICSGGAANILIASSENGVLYQLRNDATNALIGPAVAGTGASISLPTGTLTATTTFNVLASNGTCSIELTDKETITVGTAPDATLAVNVTIDPVCAGGISDVTVTLSQNGVTYQLRNDADDSNVGTAVTGTGGTISLSTGVLNATTTFNVLATSVGCASVELTATATVNVSGAVNAGLTVSAAADPICANSGTDIQVDLSEAGVSYQLRDNATNALIGTAVAGTGGTILLPTGNLTVTTTFNVLAGNGTCSIVLTTTPTVNVDAAPDPTLTVGATLNPLCVGGTSDVTVGLSQVGVSYQLRHDSDDSDVGTAVVGTGGIIFLSTGVLNTTTTFNVLATSGVCTPVELTNVITINVSGTLNAGLTVSSSAATICAGSGTFVQVQASETGVTYQLRDDATDAAVGSPVTGTGVTINLPTGNLSVTTTYNIDANNGTCSIELTNKQTITVNPAPNLALSVSPAPAIICPGNSSSIVVANSEVGISYQLRNNVGNVLIGGPVAGTGLNLSLSTGALSSTTAFNVLAIAGTCSAQLTGTASVSVRLAGDPACGGTGGTDCTNFSAIVPTIVTQPSCNDRDAGIVSFAISRADATPTTFRVIWTFNGGTPQTKFTSNTVAFNDLSSGLYQYTVIDEGNGKTCGPVDFFLDLQTQVKILTKQVTSNVTCYGGTDGNAILSVDGTTTGEYWYKYVLNGTESSAQTFTPGAPLPGGLPADDNAFIILKVDDNFNFTCPDTVMIRIKHTYPKIDFTVAATDVTTCNGTDGGIQVTAIGGGDSGTTPLQIRLKRAVPFTTDPTGYVVVSDFEDVAAGAKSYTGQPQGNYIVDIRDHLDCTQSKPIAIQAPGQVPLSSVSITAADANCTNNGQSGSIRVSISDAGIYKVALSQDQVNTPADADFIDYNAPGLPSVTFSNLASGVYYIYLKSSTTTCPTRTDAIIINGVKALADFEVLSNCENVNLTINNLTGQQDAPFVIRVFNNNDKFFVIDSLAAGAIPISNSVSFNYSAAQHTFLVNPGTYRFVMIQNQTTGTGTCALVSDTVVYQVRELLGITLGQINPSFPAPKHTGSIQIANISGGTRFVSTTNDLYYEISLTTADDDIVVVNWAEVKLDPQNKFVHLFDYLPQGVYTIKVRDAAGCVVTQVVEIPLDTSVYVPNMFTPNEDNINDEFEVLNLPIDGTHKLIITNRWGNEVFKSNDYRNGNFWTGESVADGVYFYRLKVDGGDTFTGWVEIIRGSKP